MGFNFFVIKGIIVGSVLSKHCYKIKGKSRLYWLFCCAYSCCVIRLHMCFWYKVCSRSPCCEAYIVFLCCNGLPLPHE